MDSGGVITGIYKLGRFGDETAVGLAFDHPRRTLETWRHDMPRQLPDALRVRVDAAELLIVEVFYRVDAVPGDAVDPRRLDRRLASVEYASQRPLL